jgi:hypothetical protein
MEALLDERIDEGFEDSLDELNRAVAAAVAFFSDVDEALQDGEQTARQALAHIVFWHREYGRIVRALGEGPIPALRPGTYNSLNHIAYEEFADTPMAELAHRLSICQRELEAALRALPDITTPIPLKEGGRPWPADALVPSVTSHIDGHVRRLRRAGRTRPRDQKERRP